MSLPGGLASLKHFFSTIANLDCVLAESELVFLVPKTSPLSDSLVGGCSNDFGGLNINAHLASKQHHT